MWETFGHSTPWHSSEKNDGFDVTAIDAAIRHDDGADTEEDDGLDNGTYTMHCRHFTQNGFCLLTSQDSGWTKVRQGCL